MKKQNKDERIYTLEVENSIKTAIIIGFIIGMVFVTWTWYDYNNQIDKFEQDLQSCQDKLQGRIQDWEISFECNNKSDLNILRSGTFVLLNEEQYISVLKGIKKAGCGVIE